MRVAIAGGHGQIALRLAKILSERGDEVVALIRNPDHAGDVRNAGASTKDQTLSAALHGEALLAAQDASMLPLLERLAALTNGHDDVRLEIAGRIAGRWFAAMDSDAGHELIAAGLLILAGPFDGDRLAGGLRRGLHEPPDQAP